MLWGKCLAASVACLGMTHELVVAALISPYVLPQSWGRQAGGCCPALICGYLYDWCHALVVAYACSTAEPCTYRLDSADGKHALHILWKIAHELRSCLSWSHTE